MVVVQSRFFPDLLLEFEVGIVAVERVEAVEIERWCVLVEFLLVKWVPGDLVWYRGHARVFSVVPPWSTGAARGH